METNYLDELYRKDFNDIFEQKLQIDSPLKVASLDNGWIFPIMGKWNQAGVVNDQGQIEDLAAFEPLNFLDGYRLKKEDISGFDLADQTRFKNESVIYLGAIRNHWGHFLMDSISRLWFALESGELENEQFVYFGEEIQSSAILSFFDLLGIKKNQLHFISEPTKYAQIIIPENSFVPGKYIHPKFRLAIDKILSKIKKKSDVSRIYLSRTRLTNTHEWGEQVIEQAFSENGFQVIFPESLPLEEQISYIQSADEVACLSGTLPHTLIFAKDRTKLIVLNKSYKRENYRQSAIDELKQLQVTYIDSHISLAPVFAGGPFWIKKNENLTKFFNDHQLLKIPQNTYRENFLTLGKYLFALAKLYFNIMKGTRRSPVKVINRYALNQSPPTVRALFSFYISSVFKK